MLTNLQAVNIEKANVSERSLTKFLIGSIFQYVSEYSLTKIKNL